jgi:histidinol-phosphate phosphatase family protein
VVISAAGRALTASATLGTDQEILRFITEAIPAGTPGLIAIDAPLSVPNETGGRDCDRLAASVFRRFEAAPYLANRQNLARYGGLRAEAICEQLRCLGFRHDPWLSAKQPTRRVIEVFPHPATVSLFHLQRTLKYKARAKRPYPLRWRELASLREHLVSLAQKEPPLSLPSDIASLPIHGLRGRNFKETEDLLDAFVCAYSALFAWHHGRRGYAVYGDATSGHILIPMTESMWQRIKTGRILFLDRDGTLNRTFSNRPPNDPSEIELLPSVAFTLHQHAAMGWRIVIITNQAGVAFGYLTEEQAWATHQALLDALPIPVDASYLCPHHPEGTILEYAFPCPNRKPAPGAAFDALRQFKARESDCLFVGDQHSDRQAADLAGIPFLWAKEFFGWEST